MAAKSKAVAFPLSDIANTTKDLRAIAKRLDAIPEDHELTMQQSDAIDDFRVAAYQAITMAETFTKRYYGH
jgi:hypothetical protein